MNKEKFLKLTTEDLPSICYGVKPIDNSIIIIKKYETGYYNSDIETTGKSESEIESLVNDLNEKMGISEEQRKLMEIKSMFGNW